MINKRHLAAAVALTLSLAALTGSALAAPPETPPGQEQRAENSQAPSTPPGQENRGQGQDNSQGQGQGQGGGTANAPGQQRKQESASSQTARGNSASSNRGGNSSNSNRGGSSTSNAGGGGQTQDQPLTRWSQSQGKALNNVPPEAASIPAGSTGTGPGNSGWHKYTVCHNGHAITVDVHSASAHVGGHGDSFLPFNTKGTALCEEEEESVQVSQQQPVVTVSCPTTTQVITGVAHETGSESNPIVIIHPSENSAHLTKHGEDVTTITLVVATGESCAATVPSNPGQFNAVVAETKSAVATVLGVPVVATGPAPTSGPAVAGGVAGVIETTSSPAGGEAGGVAGAFGVLGAVAGGTLPFTGLPLWVVALAAIVLIAGGLLLVRRGRTARDVV